MNSSTEFKKIASIFNHLVANIKRPAFVLTLPGFAMVAFRQAIAQTTWNGLNNPF